MIIREHDFFFPTTLPQDILADFFFGFSNRIVISSKRERFSGYRVRGSRWLIRIVRIRRKHKKNQKKIHLLHDTNNNNTL